MKKSIGKAAEFLRKVAAALRGKAGMLRARLLFLASLRRRTAVVAGISRQIRALTPTNKGQEKAVVPSRLADHTDDDDERAATPAVGMAELASLFHEVVEDDGHGVSYQADWTLALRSLFDDDEEEEDRAAGDLLDDSVGDDDDDPSVIELIRSRREDEGKEFRIDDEIDHAADMFITRVRRRRMGAHHRGL